MSVPRITDDSYLGVQKTVELLSSMLLDPSLLGKPALDAFIERAERSAAVGSVLHPSEFREAGKKLEQVLTCARALRDARDRIAKVADA